MLVFSVNFNSSVTLQSLIIKLAQVVQYFLHCLPKKWGIEHVEKGIFDGQKTDKTNLSDLAFRTD